MQSRARGERKQLYRGILGICFYVVLKVEVSLPFERLRLSLRGDRAGYFAVQFNSFLFVFRNLCGQLSFLSHCGWSTSRSPCSRLLVQQNSGIPLGIDMFNFR
jgi:hypothetical protein